MDSQAHYRPATLALHAGHTPDASSHARAVPIYQTSSYVFDSAQHAANLFGLKQFGNIYTRIMNPTTDVLEQRLAALDGGVGALAVASGAAAITLLVLNLAQTGDNIVSGRNLYGGTHTFFEHTLPKMGIEVRFVDSGDPANFAAAIDERTKLLYTESVGNPRCNIDDFRAIADVAHAAGIPFAVDNTVSPYIFRPFEHGADLAVYSLTKFIGGHGTSIGGAVVDSGRFDWAASPRFAPFAQPDPAYHGLVWTEAFGLNDRALIRGAAYIMKARLTLLRDTGACVSPFNSFLFLQGLETIHVRMERHCQNAAAVAQYLASNPSVAWVNYSGLPSHPDYVRAQRYFPTGPGAVFGFGIKGGLRAGVKLIESLKLVSHLANIGDAKTLIIHPASTTHQQLSTEDQLAAGVTEDFLRISVGIEDVADIIADLDQAIRVSQA